MIITQMLFALSLMTDRVRARFDSDAGQTAAEYMGILFVAAGIVTIVATSGIAGELTARIGDIMTNLFTTAT